MVEFFADLTRRHVYRLSIAAIVFAALLAHAVSVARFAPVFGATWEAVSFTTIQEEEDARGWGTVRFAAFLPDVRVIGGCNSLIGQYALTVGNGIAVKLNAASMMNACAGYHDRLIGLVDTARSFSLKDGDLFLEVEGGAGPCRDLMRRFFDGPDLDAWCDPLLRNAGTLRFHRCSDIQLPATPSPRGC